MGSGFLFKWKFVIMKIHYLKALFLILLTACIGYVQGQPNEYYPKGDPDKWNFEITPFLWLPAIGGEVSSARLSEDYNIPAIDLLSNLKMAFMINGEVSKGKFFLAPSYMYTKLGSEEVLWTSTNGEKSIVAIPDLKLNIVEVISGARFRVNDFLIFDPFVGFRYTNYNISASVEGIADTNSFNEKTDFWDPVLGFQMHYYPHPRVPIILKMDVGGFGVGSVFSWSTSINSGYTLSPSFDLLAGISAIGSNYETENALGNTIGLNMIMYGFDLGVKYHIPKRSKDKSVFKKFQ